MVDEEADQTATVRRGYNELSLRYRSDDAPAGDYGPWLSQLQQRLSPAARVLDVGCGCGVPMSRDLAVAGYRVTGVDLSDEQIRRARRLVPHAEFIRADVTTLDWSPASFDAITALYSIIHMPLGRQPALLAAFARWLDDDGILLLTAGARAWTGTGTGWLGGTAPMWWSHADTATYRSWLVQAGLLILDEAYVPEDAGGHSLFWATRPAHRPGSP